MFQNFHKSSAKKSRPKGSALVELIIVTILFVTMITAMQEIFISSKKLTGQAYIQHESATILWESNNILSYMRNRGFDLLINGTYYLVPNPGANSWLLKNSIVEGTLFIRRVVISDALRHVGTDNLYLDGDTGTSYVDLDTKRLDISVLWAPDYLPQDLISHTIYVVNWLKTNTYSSI